LRGDLGEGCSMQGIGVYCSIVKLRNT
jgi:hypothetical protein